MNSTFRFGPALDAPDQLLSGACRAPLLSSRAIALLLSTPLLRKVMLSFFELPMPGVGSVEVGVVA